MRIPQCVGDGVAGRKGNAKQDRHARMVDDVDRPELVRNELVQRSSSRFLWISFRDVEQKPMGVDRRRSRKPVRVVSSPPDDARTRPWRPRIDDHASSPPRSFRRCGREDRGRAFRREPGAARRVWFRTILFFRFVPSLPWSVASEALIRPSACFGSSRTRETFCQTEGGVRRPAPSARRIRETFGRAEWTGRMDTHRNASRVPVCVSGTGP
jgi:hypothetical protein